jgi:hypothetical protein
MTNSSSGISTIVYRSIISHFSPIFNIVTLYLVGNTNTDEYHQLDKELMADIFLLHVVLYLFLVH